ncbi:MAG: sulfatase [Planctomycetota bacterium]|nr:MAG: sulfatase [Planctomycetota bacterium]
MNAQDHFRLAALRHSTRRHFLRHSIAGLGALWLGEQAAASTGGAEARDPARPLAQQPPAGAPKAKRVIYLHMAGSPSQLELFAYKPELVRLNGQDCPPEFLEGKRFAFIRGVPQLLGSVFPFHQAGQAGHWISDRLPHFERVIDKVSFIHTLHTDQFNHAPAQLLLHTGNQRPGYASAGAWVAYGLGSENQNLPGFIVLLSGGRFPDGGKGVWSSGFLPSVYQGVQCRSSGDPVLFLSNPQGMSRELRGRVVEAIAAIDRQTHADFGDPETVTRIAQYEMAFRMQTAAAEAMDLSGEPDHIHRLYGTQPGQESLANNCLLARRLVERGVRFVQLFDWGWDSHGSAESEALNAGFKLKCEQLDRPVAALLADLDQRGLLDETLVVWSGEFGRTPMRENRGGREMAFIGRDHHPFAFTIWMAGGGVKRGVSYGETDAIGYAPVKDPVSVQDLHATMLHLLGLDPAQLSVPFQGLDQKLTGVKEFRIIEELIA